MSTAPGLLVCTAVPLVCLMPSNDFSQCLQERTYRGGCQKSCRRCRARQERQRQRQEEKVATICYHLPIINNSTIGVIAAYSLCTFASAGHAESAQHGVLLISCSVAACFCRGCYMHSLCKCILKRPSCCSKCDVWAADCMTRQL